MPRYQFHKGRLPIPPGVGWIRKWLRPYPSDRRNEIAPLIDLFAAASLIDAKLRIEEIDTVLDFLRITFPEQDHGWMSRRLHRAVEQAFDLEKAATKIAPTLNLRQGRRLLFELLVLLQNSEEKSVALQPVARIFGEEDFFAKLPAYLRGEIEGDNWLGQPAVLERLLIGGKNSEIKLAAGDNLSVTVVRSDTELWVLNRGDASIRVRGKLLRHGHWLRLGYGHDIRGVSSQYSQQELSYFLDARKMGFGPPLFLSVEEGLLLADRSRGRDSLGKLEFAINTRVEALAEGAISIDGQGLNKGEVRELGDDAFIEVENCGQFPIREMRRRSLELGGHFELHPREQRLRASNQDREAELRLSPDLAPPMEIEIQYSHQLREGQITRLKGLSKATLRGRPLKLQQSLKDGDLIRLSRTQSIRCRFSSGTLEEELTHVTELRVEGLTHRFPDGNLALSHLDLDLKSGEMLAIIGPSGCGKSTLLEILAGHQIPSRGKVRYNGMSLYRWRSRLLPLIAQLPHEEALNPELTVREHLEQALIARTPEKKFRRRQRRIHLVLEALDLHHRADFRVGTHEEKILSAGERSRLNLGLDLVGDANVFLLDEPIAGLSSKDAEHIIESLHQLSRERLVIATLHRPNPSILRHFDRILVLDYGGHLAYCGPRAEATAYFRRAAEELGLGSFGKEQGSDLIFEVLENAHSYEGISRRKNSTLWSDRFESYRLMEQIRSKKAPARSQLGRKGRADDNLPIPRITRHRPDSWFRLFNLQLRRDLLIRHRSRSSFLVLLLQPLLLGWLISGILRYTSTHRFIFHDAPHVPAFLFLTSVVAMFFGLSTAATDLLRDAPVLRRERNARPIRSAYLSAKAVCFGLVCGLQCLLYLLVALPLLDFPWHSLSLIWILLPTALCGSSLAMLNSLLLRTERSAMAAVPVLLVPQVLLAGALVPFDQMNHQFPSSPERNLSHEHGEVPPLARINPLRYSFESLIVQQAEQNQFQYSERKIKKFRDRELQSGRSAEIQKQALIKLHFLQADKRAEAASTLDRLVNAARRNSDEILASCIGSTNERARPLEVFFTNSTVNDSVMEAEIHRLSTQKRSSKPVFLAKQRVLFGFPVATPAFNLLFLTSFSLILWFSSLVILRHRYDRPKRPS